MAGLIENGIYTQPHGNFSCPLEAKFLGLNGTPEITDTVRMLEQEYIPLSQRRPGDAKHMRVVRDETLPSRVVTFKDASGTVIVISSGKRVHSIENSLNDGMSGSLSWRFVKEGVSRPKGRMVMGLLLVPWHDPRDTYMGINALRAYQSGQGGEAKIYLVNNLVFGEHLHTVTIKIPLPPLLSEGVHVRDLIAVRDDIAARPDLQKKVLGNAKAWLAQCRFLGEEP